MTLEKFKGSLAKAEPPAAMSAPLTALWWDAKGDWARAHNLVDELETADGMAVHAYLHRKEGNVTKTLTIGMRAPDASFIARSLLKSGRHWLKGCFSLHFTSFRACLRQSGRTLVLLRSQH